MKHIKKCDFGLIFPKYTFVGQLSVSEISAKNSNLGQNWNLGENWNLGQSWNLGQKMTFSSKI